MTHEERVEYFLRDMRRRGVSASTAAPPFDRLLWALRLRTRPSLMCDWWSLFASFGLVFGVLFGGLMSLTTWRAVAPDTQLLLGSLSGILFGAGMATYYRWKARQLELPAWEDYPPLDAFD